MNKILIVDDEPSITDGLVALLQLEEIPAAGAYDRETAEQMIAAEFFPLIVADLRLRTQEDGLMLLESIRRISPQSRVASLTGFATDEIEMQLRALGSTVVLHKPLGFEEIVSLLEEMLAEIETAAAACRTEEIDTLYDQLKRVLFSIPQKRYGLTAEESDELVQQAWCLFLEKRASIQHANSWLSGTVANLCKQQIQRNTRVRATSADSDAAAGLTVERPSDTVLMIRQALSRVDRRSRELCVLIGMEGCSYEEVSEKLGIALGSVGPLYIRAKNRLRKAMEN